jgi:hypothetical protein
VTRLVGTSILSSRLGVPVEAESIRLSASGEILVRGLVVRAAGVAGPAGEFARAETIDVHAPWWRGLWGGDVPLRSVEVDGLVVRLSQSLEDGRANVPAFKIAGGGGGDLPVARITRGHFELGEHTSTAFHTLRKMDLTGDLKPQEAAGHYTFDLRQPGGEAGALALTGTITPQAVEGRLDGVTLDVLTAESVPGPLRELFAKLNLQGRIAGTTFAVAIPGAGAPERSLVRGIDAAIELHDVAVTLPFEDLSSAAPAGQRYPRLSAVSGMLRVRDGELSARLIGKLEDLPAEVTLSWKGTTLDAPFEATIATKGFELAPSPRLLPFLPPIVHKRLDMFSRPSGIVDSRVVVTRGAGESAPKVSGTIEFREGRASFVRFPYEFKNMTALFEFDESSLRIVRLEGKAENGASLHLRGLITPLTDEAAVNLDIQVRDVPVDESLAEGLGPRRRGVLDALFSNPRREELLAAGLIVTPEEASKRAETLAAARAKHEALKQAGRPIPDAMVAELALAEARATAPAFTLGGIGNVNLKLDTPFGRNMPWTQIIEIEIPQAGILPKRFPLPMIARDVKLLVDDTVLSVEGGRFSALRGGEATVHARADFSSSPAEVVKDEKNPQRETDINISAKGMPFDDLLVNAIPAKDRPLGGVGEDARTLGDVLTGLRLRGAGEAEIWIGDVAPGEIGFKARVGFAGATCSPDSATMLTDVGGTLDVDDRSFKMNLGASLSRHSDAGTMPAGRLGVDVTAAFPEGGATTFESRIDVTGLDTSARVEGVVGLFSPVAGRTITQLRDRFQPAGAVDLRTHVWDDGASPLGVQVEASGGRGVELTYVPELVKGAPLAGPVRLAMGPWTGMLKFDVGAGEAASKLRFENLRAGVHVPTTTHPVADLTLDGVLEIKDGIDAGSLSVKLDGARFESPLTRAVIAERLSPDFATFLHERNPRGGFDVAMKLDRPGFAARGGKAATPWEVDGVLGLKSLAVHGETVDVDVPSATGTIRFGRERGTFEALKLVNEEWSMSIDGGWTVAPDGAPSLNATFGGTSQGVPASLMSLLPLTVRDLATAVDLKAEGRMTFEDVKLSLGWPAPGSESSGPVPSFASSGTVGFENLGADVGVLVTKADGTVRFETSRTPKGEVAYTMSALLPTARAASVAMTNLTARLHNGSRPGETIVPEVRGSCHGGNIAVEAQLRPQDPAKPDGPASFETLISIGGVALNGVMSDLSPGRTAAEPSPLIDGSITLGGIAGDVSSRRGRGTLTAGGGAVIDMPVLLPLITFSNFQIPVGERLDTAIASFFITGPTVALERVSVLSPGIELRGFGTVTWPGMDLNLVFNSRSNTRIPVLTPILEGFRNELVTTVVRGTAINPRISVEPFRTARGALSGIFADKSEADLMMSGLESRSGASVDRDRVSPPPTSPR